MVTTDTDGTSTDQLSYVTAYINSHNNVLITDEDGTDTLYNSKEDVIAKYNDYNENKFIAITQNNSIYYINRLIHIAKKCFVSNKRVYKLLFGNHSDIISKENTQYTYEMFNHSIMFSSFSIKNICVFKNFNELGFTDSHLNKNLGFRVMYLGNKTTVSIQN